MSGPQPSKPPKETEEVETDTRSTKDRIRDYRIERFEELRFTRKEAEVLADSKDSKGFAISWHAVRRALNAGCGHRKAAWIFSSEVPTGN